MYLKNKSSRHLPVESNLHDKQIQIGLPVIWTGHARVKRHYVKAFYISFVTLIKFLKERPVFHVEMCDKAPQKLVSSAAEMNGRQRTCTIFFVFEGQAAIMRCKRVKFLLIN